MAILGEILMQTFYYFIIVVLSVGVISILMKGFFWKYLKVKTGFGKYVLIKIRTQLRDYFAVGIVEDGFLIYKHKKEQRRFSLGKEENVFYRTLGVNWVDVVEQQGAISKVDYTPVSGHDQEMESNLLVRALTRPSVADNRERIILLLLIGIGIATIIGAFLTYNNYSMLKAILVQLPTLGKAAVISGSNSLI